jgi:hypothetical protein
MTQTAAEQTRFEAILIAMKEQNSRLVQNVSRLESIGHKVLDTNDPSKSEGQTTGAPNGLLETAEQEVRNTIAHNDRLEQLTQKLSSLL